MTRIKRLLKKCFDDIVIPVEPALVKTGAEIQRIYKRTGFPITPALGYDRVSEMTRRKAFFTVRVEGESMLPELVSGRRYIASGIGVVRVGDFAVFRNPKEMERIFVKKVADIRGDLFIMESSVSWGSSSRDFGPVPQSLIIGKIWR